MSSNQKPPYERPVAVALDVLVSHLVAAGEVLGVAEITALRERVEDVVVGALDGVEFSEMPEDWSAEEALEQVALHAAMEMLFTELSPASPGGA
jgi:hypothetical protein